MLTQACARIETLDTIEAVWDALLAVLGAQGLPIVMHISSDEARDDVRVLSNAPGIYGHRSPREDPFLDHCCHGYEISYAGVGFMDDHPYLDAADRDLIERAAKGGFVTGLGVPTRLEGSARYGGFLMGSPLDRAMFIQKIVPQQDAIRLFCLMVHRRLEELGFDSEGMGIDTLISDDPARFRARAPAPRTDAAACLSPRENEVLWLQLQGMPRKEVARMCGISPHTVAEYTSKAYRKLGVRNKIEAARLLLAEGDGQGPARP